ncbi:hypothetical protein BC937DRAFT_91622 [Endogone sp. FLAS-F59071]|nr:hypothetical protein BC937DRAFT_91622 [Endogone sp. FLAS-F59071]|eukprot:RUS16088.1 hypothetical protein BC937DRAFT_91622 [Endogone sp. FLAS-F59071]
MAHKSTSVSVEDLRLADETESANSSETSSNASPKSQTSSGPTIIGIKAPPAAVERQSLFGTLRRKVRSVTSLYGGPLQIYRNPPPEAPYPNNPPAPDSPPALAAPPVPPAPPAPSVPPTIIAQPFQNPDAPPIIWVQGSNTSNNFTTLPAAGVSYGPQGIMGYGGQPGVDLAYPGMNLPGTGYPGMGHPGMPYPGMPGMPYPGMAYPGGLYPCGGMFGPLPLTQGVNVLQPNGAMVMYPTSLTSTAYYGTAPAGYEELTGGVVSATVMPNNAGFGGGFGRFGGLGGFGGFGGLYGGCGYAPGSYMPQPIFDASAPSPIYGGYGVNAGAVPTGLDDNGRKVYPPTNYVSQVIDLWQSDIL